MVLLAVDISSASDALTTLITGLEGTHDQLAQAGDEVMRKLGLIEVALALLWCMFQGESIKTLLQKSLVLAMWMTIVGDFHELAKGATKWLVNHAGAVGGSADPWELVLNPAEIMKIGLTAGEPLMKKASSVSLLDSGDTFMICFCALLLILAFVFLTVHVAFTVIEFYLYLNVSALLIPFAVLQHTRFVADKAINAVIGTAIKLAVVTYIMAALKPILEAVELRKGFGDRTEELTWNEIFAMLLVSALCLFISVAAPRMAAGLLHGSPSLSGTGVVLGAAAMALGGAQLAGQGAFALGKAIFRGAESGFGWLGNQIPQAKSPQAPQDGGGGGAPRAPAPPPPRPVTYHHFGDQQRLAPPPKPALPAGRGGSAPQLGRGAPLLLGPGGSAGAGGGSR